MQQRRASGTPAAQGPGQQQNFQPQPMQAQQHDGGIGYGATAKWRAAQQRRASSAPAAQALLPDADIGYGGKGEASRLPANLATDSATLGWAAEIDSLQQRRAAGAPPAQAQQQADGGIGYGAPAEWESTQQRRASGAPPALAPQRQTGGNSGPHAWHGAHLEQRLDVLGGGTVLSEPDRVAGGSVGGAADGSQTGYGGTAEWEAKRLRSDLLAERSAHSATRQELASAQREQTVARQQASATLLYVTPPRLALLICTLTPRSPIC